MISKKSVEDIQSTAKIEEIIGDFMTLKRSGSNMVGLCPFHHEKTPSFSVSPSKNIYKCFGCGKAGGPVQFIMEHESYTFPEALRYVAKKYNITIEENLIPRTDEEYQAELKKESYNLINEYAGKLYQDSLLHSPQGQNIGLAYFKERGYRDNIIGKFQLGFAPDERNYLSTKALQAGYKIEVLQELGLTTGNGHDFFNNRVIFPIHNILGKIIAFSGRKMSQSGFGPKYINSPETPVYSKSKVLYGLNLAKTAIRAKDECILVEGYTDVITLHQAGIENVVASSGTALTIDQIRLIKRYSPNVKILYDGDQAGIKATLRALDLIIAEDMNVRIVLLPAPEDPDSFLKNNGSDHFIKYIAEQAVDFVLFKASLIKAESKNDPIKKSEGITEIVHTIAKINDAIKRSTYIKVCSDELDISEGVLIKEVNKLIKKEIYDRHIGGDRNKEEQIKPIPAEAQIIIAPDNDEYQERSLIRVLILYGHLHPENDPELTMAHFILNEFEEFMDDFDNKLYEQIAKEYRHELNENKIIDTNYFIQHAEEKIRSLAIGFSHLPYAYSHNWEDRWEMGLQTQKPPDQNYTRDGKQSLLHLKLRKIQKMIRQNTKALMDPDVDESKRLVYLRSQHMMLEQRNEIANELGIRLLN